MRRYYVNASNEKRTELILWAEDKLFFHEMEKEFRETMEKERRRKSELGEITEKIRNAKQSV